MKNKKYLKYGVIGLVCLVIIAVIYLLFILKRGSETNSNVQYAVAEVKKGHIEKTVSGTGTIAASVRKEIMTLTGGIVDSIFVEEGQHVEEGDLLLTFENSTDNLVIEQARLNVLIAENSLKELEKDVNNLKITAPASGVIGDIKVNTGAELSKGYTLTTITDKLKVEIVGKFNKTQVSNIRVGDSAEVFLLDSLQSINGTVTKVSESPGDNEGAVLYDVTVEVDNPGGLTSGMKAQVTVKNRENFPAVETAEIKAKTPINVELPTGGTLKKLYVSSGDRVKKGELIGELENENLLVQVENQQIKVEQSRLELNEKLENLENAAVFAPITGVITKINVTKGESVHENTAVAVVSDLENLEVIIPVDELDIKNVEVGQDAEISVGAQPDMKYSAKVSSIALEGTATSGVTTFDVTLTLNKANGLKPGMTASVEIICDKREDVLILPVEAVQQRGESKIVLTGNEDDVKAGKPSIVPVKIGLVSENYVEITEGLKEGDTVFYQVTGHTSQLQRNTGMGIMQAGGGPPPVNRRQQ